MNFSAPALHLQTRERYVDWSRRQRAGRLGMVATHSRFLVLPERRGNRNLASRVLGLTMRRLSTD